MANPPDLPNEIYDKGFAWPQAYRRLFERELTGVAPWYFLEGDDLATLYKEANARHTEQGLVPFARRNDNGDIACFTVLVGIVEARVLMIQAPSGAGTEMSIEFPTFWDWFRLAVDDMIETEEGEPDPT